MAGYVAFLLMAVCLCAGAMIQGFGFCLLFFIPFGIYLGSALRWEYDRFLFDLGACLVGIYWVFTLTNILSRVFCPEELCAVYQSYAWKNALVTPVSSAIGGTGFCLLGMRFIPQIIWAPKFSFASLLRDSLKKSVFAWAFASAIVAAYGWYQYQSGYDYRLAAGLPVQRILPNGHYRIQAFYGHPLSLASVNLALIGFFAYLSGLKAHSKNVRVGMIVVTLMQIFILYMSASRMAFLLCTGYLGGLVLFHLRKHTTYFALGIFGAILSAMSILSSGRFAELWQRMGEDRLTMWKVHLAMIWQRPFLGMGHGWLRSGLREKFYEDFGLASFERKYNAHNFFLEILASGGLLSLAVIVFLTFRIHRLLKAYHIMRDHEAIWCALGISMVLNLWHGLTQNTFFDTHLIYIYYSFFWALVWKRLFLQGTHP